MITNATHQLGSHGVAACRVKPSYQVYIGMTASPQVKTDTVRIKREEHE